MAKEDPDGINSIENEDNSQRLSSPSKEEVCCLDIKIVIEKLFRLKRTSRIRFGL